MMVELKFPLLLCCLAAAAVFAAERFPFVIPGDDAIPSATDMSHLSSGPAGADGFVTIRDGRFHTNRGRLKIWGVNTCFGANFPTHEEAEKIAAHLAKLGVNGVRMHHHDWFDGPRGVWKEVVDGRRVFDSEQLDRQDYFLARLHENGIYANLNLHVSRTFTEEEGFLSEGLPRAMSFDKYLLYFEPRMRERFKEFCRMYLTHENSYRQLRRVEDPGVAMLEITNENSFSEIGPGLAASLPEPYRGEFKRQWNVWLEKSYGSTAALREAWRETSEPLGDDVADVGDLGSDLGAWYLRSSDEYLVEPIFDQSGPRKDLTAIKLDIIRPVSSFYLQELMLQNLSLEEDRLYTLSFWVKADEERTLFIDISNQGPDDWRSLGYEETVRIGPDWQLVERAFRAAETNDGNARICFKFGGSEIDLYLADVRLRTGGTQIALPEGQSIEEGNVEIPAEGWVFEAGRDVRAFMVEVEKGFIRDITGYLKDELGVRVPITASQITYHGAEIVAETCDFADIHGYWQHPHFPNVPWDRDDWTIANSPMERVPGRDTMLDRARWRLFDRPFTMSEWNIADPNDYGASVVPFAAVTAALQDWDGVFFFQYHGSESGWFRDSISGYFSFNGQPVKLALLAACANLFRRDDLSPLPSKAAGTLTELLPARLGLAYQIGIDPQAVEPVSLSAPEGDRLSSPDGNVVWDASDPQKAAVAVNSPASRAVWGLIAEQTFELGDLIISVGEVERNYAAVVVTSLDGLPLEESKQILLTAVGSAENLNMGWNEERTSVGSRWGTGPTQVNGIAATLILNSRVKNIHALDGRGLPAGEVPVKFEGGEASFTIGPEYRTLWYVIEAE